jgi:large exoprotein involved in heme utilization and adhesion
VLLNTQQLTLDNDAQILASNVSSSSKDIILEGLDTLTVSNNSAISASTQTGKAGSLSINANSNPATSVVLSDNSRLSAEVTGQGGNAGEVSINTRQLTLLNNSQILASNISGVSQGISLEGLDTLQVSNNSQISTSTQTGQAGSLRVNANSNPANSVLLSDKSRLSAQANEAGGNAGEVSLNTKVLTLQNGAQVLASNVSGASKDIRIEGLDTLILSNNSQISTSTQTGQAGSLSVNANNPPATSVQLDSNSRLSAQANEAGGTAGEVSLNTRQLSLQDESQVSSSNVSGISEGIRLEGLDTLTVSNSEISASTQTGTAGSLSINANSNPAASVQISSQGSRLSTEATETGNAGSLTINTRQLSLQEGAKVSTSTVSGIGRDITLQGLNTLSVSNNSQISTSTQTGQAGSLSVNANENPGNTVLLSGNSSLSAQATGAGGKAGSVTINTRQLNLQNQSEISSSNISGVSEGITLQGLDTLNVNNSLISASTQTGSAGSLSVNAAKSVELSGEGGLSVEATKGGMAGNLTIETGQMSVRDGAQVTVSSPQGQAGNLIITANSLFLNRGTLSAETAETSGQSGANITLKGLDQLRMENESLISARALNTANGGNITIDTTFLIALPSVGANGSDIIATAVQGRGGEIKIAGAGIFGLAERRAIPGNRTNDIDASSEFGAAGDIQLNTLVNPSQGLSQLPNALVDPTRQIAQECAARGEDKNKFTITGRGGLPQSPNEVLTPDMVQDDLGTPVASNPSTRESVKPTPTSPPQQLVEAQGWVVDDLGVVTLVAAAPSVTPHSGALVPASCQIRETTGKADEGVVLNN